jgi:ribonucleoside-diphosphate reductase beta chain
MLLDPGMDLTLRPMRYPDFYERYRAAIRNTWTVEEVDLHNDLADLARMTPQERHLINRLVAFFATGDSIVANNLVLNLYQHVNAPEARLYLSRQLFEEAVHVQFYLTLLDTYLPDPDERVKAFDAIEHIPSIRDKAEFCFRWIDSINGIQRLESADERRMFLLNLICFAACIEGLFFYGAFAYVYWFRSRGLLSGLATGTNWVFRDESMHMEFAFSVVDTVRAEEPELFDDRLGEEVQDAGGGRRGRAGLRQGPVRRRHVRHERRADARLPGVRRRPAAGPPRPAPPLRQRKSVRVHGTPGRAGAGKLLREAGLRVSGSS